MLERATSFLQSPSTKKLSQTPKAGHLPELQRKITLPRIHFGQGKGNIPLGIVRYREHPWTSFKCADHILGYEQHDTLLPANVGSLKRRSPISFLALPQVQWLGVLEYMHKGHGKQS